MEQNSKSARLHALDGIRGLAIVLVILNHINATFISRLIGPFFTQILFTSGVTGVSLLFILSGFFMSSLYPNPANSLHFLQKRYTRIFPLFLTMVAARFTFWLMPNLTWYTQIVTIIFYSLFTYIIWVYLVKKHASISIRKLIFIAFLILQAFVGSFYLFYIMRHSEIVFFHQFPFFLREGVIGLVNGTLTLPLGDYVPMLDGVYWSLVAEVLFYILYPILCVPIIHFLIPKNRWLKIIFLLSLIPLFCGLTLLSYKLAVLSMIQLYICFYFITGMCLGYLFKNKPKIFENLDKILPNKSSILTLIIFLILIFSKTLSFNFFPSSFISLIHIIWAFPITFIIAFAINNKTTLSKFLENRFLVFLGTISYSIYLIHTTVIHFFDKNIPESLSQNIFQIIIIFIVTILISSVTYYLLERPYFKRDKNAFKNKNINEYKESKLERVIKKPSVIFTLIFILYILGIFNAYQSNFNIFSIQSEFNNLKFINPNVNVNSGFISMHKNPKIDFIIVPKENNFAILMLHLVHVSAAQINIHTHQKLIFKIKQINDKNWYSINTYAVGEIKDSKTHLFGLPEISDSKNNTYLVELKLLNPNDPDYIMLDTNPYYIKGDYSVNKSELVHHPKELFNFIFSKIENAFTNPEGELVLILFIPFFILSIYLLLIKNNTR